MSQKRFIYILSLDGSPNVCKVGISINPEQRAKNLQTGSPARISVFRAWCFDNLKDARNLEAIMHAALSEYQMIGEWFGASPDRATELFFSICQIIRDKDHHPDDFEKLCQMTAYQMMEGSVQ
jgi:hypothetical protein